MTRFLTLSAVVCLIATVAYGADTRPRPNILFVLIDDMGCGDLSCFAESRVKTEQIDRLGREGIRFNRFYVNAPICSPSRVAFTTGQYPGRWRITSYLDRREDNRRRGINNWLNPAAPSLARFLAEAGYHTAHVGKWHMGGQRDVGDAPPIRDYGFASSLTNFEGLGERILPRFEPHADGRPFDHGPTKMSADLGGPIRWADRHEVTRLFVDRAVEEIAAAARAGKPFYVNLWLDDVHSPCQAPPGMCGDGSPAANYDGVMREMDRQLGRVFDRIRSDRALADNTIILLCSDNGPEPGLGTTGGLRGSKGNLYEGGIRSPLIVWSPRFVSAGATGSVNDKTVLAAMDFAPSLLALAKVDVPKDVAFDGLDMSETLVGRAAGDRGAAVMWSRPPDRAGPPKRPWPDLAIREGKWKLLVFRDRSKPELFNIEADRSERGNLANKHPDVVRRLTDQVIAWDRSIESSAASRPTF